MVSFSAFDETALVCWAVLLGMDVAFTLLPEIAVALLALVA